MNRDNIKLIILDQREMYRDRRIIKRNYILEDHVNYCFTGIRRTGKSYMMYQQILQLMEGGVVENRILYVNFEDERFLEITADDLNMILEIGIENAGKAGKPYIFLDEIQNVEGWDKFVRRLADMKYPLSITGSNSRMLSSEIASTLGGRFMIVQVFPYAFDEYLKALGNEQDYSGTVSTKDRAEIMATYGRYVEYGAFPELVGIQNKREYLRSIYQTIYLGDIITRNNVSNDFAVRMILKKLAESVMKPVSYSRLANIVKSAGANISKQTVINYISHMLDSYLIFTIQNYAAKLLEKETAPKYYFMDTGLLGLLTMKAETALLENLVAIELIRRYGENEVFYFESNIEVDFYIPEEKLAIQVCYGGLDNIETKERELRAFARFSNHIPGVKYVLITNSEETFLEYEGVKVSVIPAWKWLLEGKKESSNMRGNAKGESNHLNYLFDLDQTLLDFHASEKIALEKVLKENGLSFSDEIYHAFKSCNKSLWGELEKGKISRNELFIKRFSYIFSLCSGDAAGLDPLKVNNDFIVTMSKNGVLMDGAKELLEKIKNGIKDSRIYIVSNGATINARGRIASTGLDKYIDGLFVSEDMGVNKPAPEYFDLVLQTIGEPKETCIVIGDSLTSDMAGAKNASLTSVWFMPEGEIEAAVRAYDIDYCAASYDELFETLKTWAESCRH